MPRRKRWPAEFKAKVILETLKEDTATYNLLRTLTAEWRPGRRGGTARPGMIRVACTRNVLEVDHARAHRVFERGVSEVRPARACPAHRRGHAERPDREIRRRTRVVGTFSDGRSAPMSVAARPKYVAERERDSRRYLDVTPLDG